MQFLRLAVIRPVRALVNPRAQQTDLFRREPVAFLRHHHVVHEAGDKLNQRAFRAFAGMNRGCVIIAALERDLFHVHAKATLLLLRSVTLQATRSKDRLNVLRKIHRATRGRRQFRHIHVRRCERQARQQRNPKQPIERLRGHEGIVVIRVCVVQFFR